MQRKPAAKADPSTARAAAEPAAQADPKPSKVKRVRETFSLPQPEHEALRLLKHRASLLGLPAKKGMLLRAGLAALAAMPDARLKTALKPLAPRQS